VQHGRAGGDDRGLHVGEHEGKALVVDDPGAEGLALAGVGHRRVERALGEAANAEGWVISNEGRLRRIEIIGRWSGGKKLRLSFLATADLPPGAPVWDGVDSTRPGEGTLERDRGTRLVRRVRVVLAADGRAEIVVTSFGEFRLAGRWTAESATRVRFVATGGLSGEPGEGGGTIDLRDREVERVALTGRSGSLDYRIDFRAGAEPPPVAPRPGREELTEEPGFNLEGGDYTSVYFETLRECQGACRRDERCRAYTYNTRSRTCYLKDRAGRYERREDTVSGVKDDGR